MFFNKVMKRKVEYLQTQLKNLDERYQSVLKSRDEWKELAMKSNCGYDKGDLLIDWSKMDVISIERAPLNRGDVNGVWITNVCYWKQEVENGLPVKKLKEMIYYTDMKQHREIIETYNGYAKSLEKAKKK